MKIYKITGIDCPHCAKSLEKQINKIKEVDFAEINFLKGTLTVESKNQSKAFFEIIKTIKIVMPEAKLIDNKMHSSITNKNSNSDEIKTQTHHVHDCDCHAEHVHNEDCNKQHNEQINANENLNIKTNSKISIFKYIDLILLVVGFCLGLTALIFTSLPTWVFWVLYVLSALFMGYKTYYKAVILLIKGSINENLLVTISVIGAGLVGEYREGLMVIALYSIGKVLEGLAVNKSKKSIDELSKLSPEYAIKIVDDKEIKIVPNELKIDDVIIVKPGEIVVVDGIIIEGQSTLNLQSITGESLPVSSKLNQEILSGTIVLDGVLKIKVCSEYNDSTLTKIMDMIQNAEQNKSKTETFISKITKWYTLGVMILAVLVGTIVGLVTKNFNTALYRGLIFLVISCPCAFAISVPLSYFSGIGNASKHGILIKGSNYLDCCAKINTVAFDKTGTLTTGEFEIKDVISYDENLSKQDIIYLASLGENYSNHPLAKSIVKSNSKHLEEVFDVKEIAGEGVYFTYQNEQYFVGRKSVELDGTVVELYKNNNKIGDICLQDSIKETSKNAVKQLSKLGVKVVMLSGDNQNIVKQVAQDLNINEYHANLMPEDKYNYLQNTKKNKDNVIGYVGDGLNDAPSLALSDVGISMGINGSSASIEASDIVLVDDNPLKVASAIKISKFTHKIVWSNIIISLIIKVLFLTLGSFGITGMLAAVIADVGVTVLAILNSLRALTFKPKFKD